MLAVLVGAGRARPWRAGAGAGVSLRWCCEAGRPWARGRLHMTTAGAAVSRASLSRLLSRAAVVPAGAGAALLVRGRGWGVAHCKRRPEVVPSRLLGSEREGGVAEAGIDWSRFIQLLLPDLLLLGLAMAAALGAAVLNVYIPLELGQLVNAVARMEAGRPWRCYADQLLQPGMRLAMLYCAQSICTFFYITALSVVGERFAVRLRSRLFHSLVLQDIAFFDEHRTGELVSRLSGDVQDFKSAFKLVVSQGLRSLAQVLGCATSLYLISPHMTAVAAISLPSLIGVGALFGTLLRRWSREAQDQVAKATAVADEALSSVRTVRAFAMEDSETRLYAAELAQTEHLNTRLGTGIAVFQALSNLVINGVILAVVSYGGLLMATERISAGDLMSFLVATQTIQRSLGSLSLLFGQVVRGMGAGSRVFEYLDRRPLITPSGLVVPPHLLTGRVEFQDVRFSYPSRPDQEVLKGFSLVLPAGKVTALCGLSGAGKSTVAALLERFYDPQWGTVILDGAPLPSLDPSWLRGEVIGYISQEPVLFATTVSENIRYGKPAASDEEVFAAARLANADEFIRAFPDGYHTIVGERGVALSGGQKQRVAIARALLKDPTVLILDEATSALDAKSEHLVQAALERAMKGRTVLVIAHRLSTIRDADCIAVMHHGQLAEVGTHSELVRKNGLYAELIRRQTVLQ